MSSTTPSSSRKRDSFGSLGNARARRRRWRRSGGGGRGGAALGRRGRGREQVGGRVEEVVAKGRTDTAAIFSGSVGGGRRRRWRWRTKAADGGGGGGGRGRWRRRTAARGGVDGRREDAEVVGKCGTDVCVVPKYFLLIYIFSRLCFIYNNLYSEKYKIYMCIYYTTFISY